MHSERLVGIGVPKVVKRNKVILRQVSFWVLAFAGIGMALGIGAFIVAIAFSGYNSVFGPFIFVSYLALWPYLLLRAVVPEQLLRTFFARAPLLYLPGLPIFGWGLLGIPIGWWRASRRSRAAQTIRSKA